MNNIKGVILIVAAAAVGIAVILVVSRCIKTKIGGEILDGPGMVYRWTDYELHGTWIQTDTSLNGKRATMQVSEDKITLKDCYSHDSAFAYSLPEGVDEEGTPYGEVHLKLHDTTEFESVIFHEEPTADGKGHFPVLSGTIFEYDGRGEIVIIEFVRTEDLDKIGEGFESTTRKSHNSWEGVPKSYIEVESEEKEEK